MQASPGDRIIVRSHHIGVPDRGAQVVEVHGEGGAPPWLLRWEDDGHQSLFWPGADTTVEHLTTRS
jgi:hypothetical protein